MWHLLKSIRNYKTKTNNHAMLFQIFHETGTLQKILCKKKKNHTTTRKPKNNCFLKVHFLTPALASHKCLPIKLFLKYSLKVKNL